MGARISGVRPQSVDAILEDVSVTETIVRC